MSAPTVTVRLTVPQARALLEVAGRGYDEIETEISDEEQGIGGPASHGFGRRELATSFRAYSAVRRALEEVRP